MAALRQRLVGGELRAVELTRRTLERIERFDGNLGAFVRLNPRALEEAEQADRRLRDGDGSPLTGIPIAIKDNLATAGLETDCASPGLRGFVPTEDAAVVSRLREAGCVVLGKTNLDEFAMGSSTESSCHGPTRNPWDLDRVPGGSSGGSAAAVAAGLAPLALGSDTGGSVRQPAAFCGIVGLKPTYGRISRRGLVAFGSSLDQVGILAPSVQDAAELLEITAGYDPLDMTSAAQPVAPWTGSCAQGIEGLRVGLPREYLEVNLDREIAEAVRRAATALESAGARLEEVSLASTEFAVPAYYLLATAEASSNLARYDAVRYGRRMDAGELGTMYRASRGAGFGPEAQRRIMLGTFALSAGYHDAYYERAQQARKRIREDFLRCFRQVDLLLAPTTPTVAFLLGEKVDDPLSMYLSDIYTATASLAGLPAISIPLGLSAGLPVGGQLIGPDFREDLLLRAGAVLERCHGFLTPPFPPEEPEA